MKLQKKFTLIELLIVVSILGLLMGILVPTLINAQEQGKSAACKANLSDLGRNMISYSTDNNFFPCGVKDTDSDTVVDRKVKSSRSTVNTFWDYYQNDGNSLDPKRFFCPNSTKNVPRTKGSKFTQQNVGYHYTNANVYTNQMKGNRTLVRDLNEGHKDSERGNVLTAGGNIREISKLGNASATKGNYATNWYKNVRDFDDYKDFDNWSSNVNPKRPDEAD
ncbi:MAG: type II secretion system protein [Lentisphaeria bacterium]